MEQNTRVAVGVMIFKEGKVLMSKRKGSHGAGEFGFPGGHLELMEPFEDCVRRETKEECGLEITNISFLYVANIMRYAPKHFVYVGMIADWESGEPQLLEPECAEDWQWYDLDNLPSGPEFEFCKLGFDAYKNKTIYYS